jgi:HTH-type transcriptional regulator, competence development regulator
MKSIGEILRHLREEQKQFLREVSAGVEIDQALLSKIERGERLPNKEQVLKLAKHFKVKENELIVAWLSDKLVNDLVNEDLANEALEIAAKKLQVKMNNKKKQYGES